MTTTRVEIDGVQYRIRQRDGYVLIYKRFSKVAFSRDRLYWDSRRSAPKIDSTVARVLAKASRYATITLSKGVSGG